MNPSFSIGAPRFASAPCSRSRPACCLAPSHAAAKIQRLVSPGGIEAWFVQDATVPLIAMEYAFGGGSSQDPADKPGSAIWSPACWMKVPAIRLQDLSRAARPPRHRAQLPSTRDYLRGSLRMLKDNKDEAFDLLRLALTSPRFDAADVERIRAQVSPACGANRQPVLAGEPQVPGSRFGDHPYGRPSNGTLDSVPKINIADMKDYVSRVLAKDTLRISVVGDVDADTLGKLLDQTFGGLPAKASLTPVAEVEAATPPQRAFVPLDVPQTVVTFGGPGISRNDPDFMAGYVVNHILGGGGFVAALPRKSAKSAGWPIRSRIPALDGPLRAVHRQYRHPRRPRRRNRRRHRGGSPPDRRGRPDPEGARRGQVLSEGLADAGARHLLEACLGAAAIPARRAPDRLHRTAQCPRRRRDARRRQKGRQRLWGKGLLTVIVGRAPQAAAQPAVGRAEGELTGPGLPTTASWSAPRHVQVCLSSRSLSILGNSSGHDVYR